MKNYIQQHIKKSISVKQALLNDIALVETIESLAGRCVAAYRAGHKILIAGNGGSAADAQHIAGELVSRFYFDRPALAAQALTTDSSILTSIANDYGYEKLFARQIEANGIEGDIFIGLSTSGNSSNIVQALKQCQQQHIITVGLTGSRACEMDNLCDFILKVPSIETPRIQEAHMLIGHILCAIIEKELFSGA
ncbi:MAG: D-sedoheptulose 7-phosphate isomerase [Methylococcales bacterium]|nr:D-sedoheptulose 7-phosphate isomerase [Methylococcales bacterium]